MGYRLVSPPPQDTAPPRYRLVEPTKEKRPEWSGSILPFSRDSEGHVAFDSNAGLFGLGKRLAQSVWSGATLPGDVYAGRVDPRSDEAIARATELAAVATPLTPGVRAGEGAFAALRPSQTLKPEVPSVAALKEAGGEGFKRSREMAVDYDPAAVSQMASKLRAELEADGIFPKHAPKVFDDLRLLENPPAGSVAPLSGLHAARRSFQAAANDARGSTEAVAGTRAIQALDRFITEPPEGAVISGDASAAAGELKDAIGNWAAAARSKEVVGRQQRALRRAAAANSGSNIDNTLRQRITDLLIEADKGRTAGLDKSEIQALEGFVAGSPSRNIARQVGNRLGGGGGLGSTSIGIISGLLGGVGGVGTGLAAGVGVPATGAVARALANRLARKELSAVDDMIRARSPLYARAEANAKPVIPPMSAEQEAVLRALLLSPQAIPARLPQN